MRRWMYGSAAVGLLVAAGAFMTPASAKAPDAQGWWWIAQASSAVSVPTPPSVPADGIYVASNPQGQEAIAALKFSLADGATTGLLTLQVTGNTVGTPSLGLCLLSGAVANWRPAQGGAWTDRPISDCTSTTAGTVSSDGRTVTFQTGSLVRNSQLNVAVVPALSGGGNPTFQVAFTKPSATALAVTDPPPPSSGGSVPNNSTVSPFLAPANATSSPAISSPIVAASEPPLSAVAAPDPAPFASPASPAEVGVPASSSSSGRVLASTTRPARNSERLRTIGLIGLVGLAMVYMRLNDSPSSPPKSLVAFGGLADAEAPEGSE